MKTNDTIQSDDLLFAITTGDLQAEAREKLGRELTEDEILTAKKGLENGLLFDIDTVYSTIFDEML